MQDINFEILKNTLLFNKLKETIKQIELKKKINISIMTEKETHPRLIKFYEMGVEDTLEELRAVIMKVGEQNGREK